MKNMSASKDKYDGAGFETAPLLTAPCRGAVEDRLEKLKQQLLEPILSTVESAALVAELRAVANEGAALAWCTVCPVLVLPALLDEKIRAALARWERQQRLLMDTRPRSTPTRAAA